MKKLYTTPEYKAYQKRRLLKIEKILRKERLAELRAKRKGEPKSKKKRNLS
jgi:hypothetical protein